MAYITINIIMATLAVIGLINIVRNIVFRTYKSKGDTTIMLITPAKGHKENIEYELRSCAAKVCWMGKVRPERVVCLDNNMDDNTRQICEIVCSDYDFMDIVKPNELKEMLGINDDRMP